MSLMTFSFPTTTLFGAGSLSELPERMRRLGLNRPLIVTDPGLLGSPPFKALENVLTRSASNEALAVYSGVHSNPWENDVQEAASVFQEHQCDGVIAFGGGSPLDVGKAARLLVKRPKFKLAKFYDEPDWSGFAPFIAIPTTAGTGSEVGRRS